MRPEVKLKVRPPIHVHAVGCSLWLEVFRRRAPALAREPAPAAAALAQPEAPALCVPYEAERGNVQAWDKGEEEVSIALLNKFAREISADTKLLFMTLPPLPPAESSNEAQDLSYLSGLAELVAGLPPVALTANGQGFSVITTEI